MGDEVWLNLLEDEVDEEGGERVGGLVGEGCSRVDGRNPVADWTWWQASVLSAALRSN